MSQVDGRHGTPPPTPSSFTNQNKEGASDLEIQDFAVSRCHAWVKCADCGRALGGHPATFRRTWNKATHEAIATHHCRPECPAKDPFDWQERDGEKA